MLTQEDLELFEQMCSPAQGPDVIFMNPRDHAALKEFFACGDYLKQLESRYGRRLSGIEQRWFTAKFYKKKCEPKFVDRIPFPEPGQKQTRQRERAILSALPIPEEP